MAVSSTTVKQHTSGSIPPADKPLAPGDLVAIKSICTFADEGMVGVIVAIDDEEISLRHEGGWYADSIFPGDGDLWTLPWSWISSVARVSAQSLQVMS